MGERAKAAFKTNQTYWFAKIERNRSRDKRVKKELEKAGWLVLRFWEHEIASNVEMCVSKVRRARRLRSQNSV